MFEPRVPGLRAHPDLLSVPHAGRASPARPRARPRRASWRRRSSARAPTRSPPSSASRSTAPAACSIRPTTTGRASARSATGTTCCSSPTRSSPASAAPAAGSALAHWNVQPDILLVRQGRDLRLPAARRHHGERARSRRPWTRSSPRTAGCTPTRTRAIRPAARSALEEHRDHGARAALGERGARWATGCYAGLTAGVRRSPARRRHPRRQGPARRGRVRRGSGDQGELPGRPEVRAARCRPR